MLSLTAAQYTYFFSNSGAWPQLVSSESTDQQIMDLFTADCLALAAVKPQPVRSVLSLPANCPLTPSMGFSHNTVLAFSGRKCSSGRSIKTGVKQV